MEIICDIEAYKRYLITHIAYPIDRENELEREKAVNYNADFYAEIASNTSMFLLDILKKLHDAPEFEGKQFITIPLVKNDYISLNLCGGYKSDELFSLNESGTPIWISKYLIRKFFEIDERFRIEVSEIEFEREIEEFEGMVLVGEPIVEMQLFISASSEKITELSRTYLGFTQ